MNHEEFAELSAAAALHALSPEDARRFRDAVLAHPEWRAVADADVETADALSRPIAAAAPPADLRSALLARIAVTPQDAETAEGAVSEQGAVSSESSGSPEPGPLAAGADVSTPPAPRRWARTVFALAACLVLLVGIGIGAAALSGYLNRPAAVVALEQIEAAADAQQATVPLAGGGSATAHWSGSLGRAVLVADGIDAPADGRTYELWFVRGDTPVSAGTFTVDGDTATAELQGDMHAGDVIAVTVEQSGGSPDGQPTTDPVIVIPTA